MDIVEGKNKKLFRVYEEWIEFIKGKKSDIDFFGEE